MSPEETNRALALSVSISSAHPVFVMGVNEILAGRGPESSRETGLRVVVVSYGEPVAIAEIAGQGDATALMKPQLSGGARLRQALAIVQHELAAKADATAELRALRVPSLYVDALWLHNDDIDLFYPLETDDRRLLAREEFSAYLRDLAASSAFGTDGMSLGQAGSGLVSEAEPA